VLTGGGGADVINGGAGIDTIVSGAGADAINPGAAADVVTLGSGVDTVTILVSGDSDNSNTDHIKNFTTTVDKLVFTGTEQNADDFKGVLTINTNSLVDNEDGNGNGQSLKINLDSDTSNTSSAIALIDYTYGTSGAVLQMAASSALLGSSNNDFVTSGGSAATFTGGLGDDTYVCGTGVDTLEFAANGSVVGTDLDKISLFNTAGSDSINFTGTEVLLTAEADGTTATSDVDTATKGLITFAAADDTYAEMVIAIQADAQLDAALSVALFIVDSNTYVYFAGAATGNSDDQIVELTGVSIDEITLASANSMTIA